MSAVKFSVVIPTRERAETLRFALRTCLDQTFDDYEVVVSDNFSSPATKAVVDEAASPKVRYVRTPEPLAMSSNWEFGVGHARGEYVTVIGDDDGLLPHALAELDTLSREREAKAIRWTMAFYTWPTIVLAGQGNYLRLPLSRGLRERDGAEAIRAVAGFSEFYEELPMLYNSVVRRDVLDDVRRRAGQLFPHPIPDVYSGFAIAHAAGRYLSTSVPMSVRGVSKSSTGTAAFFNSGKSEVEREFRALNAKDGFRTDPTVPDVPSLHAPVADAFRVAKRALFPELDITIDRQAMVRGCLTGMRVTEADWPKALAVVRASLADSADLLAWFDAELADASYPAIPPVDMWSEGLGFDGTNLHLDAAAFGVVDVAAAALLCDRLLNYRHRRVQYTNGDNDSRAAREIAELTAVCDDRERAILRLHLGSNDFQLQLRAFQQTCEEREAIIHRLDAQLRTLDRQLAGERRWSMKRPLRVVKRILGLSRAG